MHFSPPCDTGCVCFCTFAETEVLGSCSVWRGGTHKGEKGENNGQEKGGRQGWRLLEGGKAGFAVFRDGSLGIVLTALAAPAFCPKPSRIVGSTQKKNCGKHPEAKLWEAHRSRIVGNTQRSRASMLLYQCSAVVPFMYHICSPYTMYIIHKPYTGCLSVCR